MEKKYKMRVSQHHWQIILEFAESHPEIITNKFSDHLQGKQNFKNLWEELTNKLNSLGQGIRTVEEWKKTLADWKSKTKKKASENAKDLIKTGGGPSSSTPLTAMEEKLISLMGTTAIYGDKSASEIGIKRKHVDAPGSSQLNEESIIFEDDKVNKRKHEDTTDASHLSEEIIIFDDDKAIERKQDKDTPSAVHTEEIIYVNIEDAQYFPDTPVSSFDKNKKTNQCRTPKTSAKKDLHEMHLEVLGVLKSIDSQLKGIDTSMKSMAVSLEVIAQKL